MASEKKTRSMSLGWRTCSVESIQILSRGPKGTRVCGLANTERARQTSHKTLYLARRSRHLWPENRTDIRVLIFHLWVGQFKCRHVINAFET